MNIIKKTIKRMGLINRIYTDFKWRERKISYGESYPDKVFFLIRRTNSSIGLFSYVTDTLGMINRAISKGYIPIVDMQNTINTYLEENEVRLKNSWEFYFEQPCGYSLQDISKAKNVILGRGVHKDDFFYPSYRITNDYDEYLFWHELANKYLHPKKEILHEAKLIYDGMFHNGRVVGVLSRGTDYSYIRPIGHPIQPKIGELISKVKDIMDKNNCEYVYLATEDDTHYTAFKEAFGDRLRVSSAKRCTEKNVQFINEVSYNREHDKYLKGYEYLINILLLTQCNCFVGAPNGGTYGTLLLGKGFEDQYIFDLGCYK